MISARANLRCLVLGHRWLLVFGATVNDGDLRICGRCGAVDRWSVIRGSYDQRDWHPGWIASRLPVTKTQKDD